jgi:DNA polymerase elongation subunit (family B)
MGNKQFLNSMYKRAKTIIDSQGKRKEIAPDALIFTLKDIETNTTELCVLERPFIDFYIATAPQPFHRVSIPKEIARKVTVPFANRDKEMAGALGLLQDYYNSWKNGSNNQFTAYLKKNPNLYAADTNIEDYYKTRAILKYGKVYAASYKKGYADIEVDISNYTEDFAHPDTAPCVINLITYIDKTTKKVYCFILYDERVKDSIMHIIQDPNGFIERYTDDIIKKENFIYYFNVYKTELELIKAFFTTIHECKPDFVGFWNMPFDMPTILNRLRRLGCSEDNIADICCHPEILQKHRYVKYISDPKRALFNADSTAEDDDEEEDTNKNSTSKNRPHPSRLIDWIEIPGYTQFFDQLSTFSCLRKRWTLPSYKLDDIGKKYGGIGKVDLADLGYSIRDVNIKNFEVFLSYNIRDSYVQYAIEEKQHDIEQMITSSFNTRLSKTFSNSIVIKNHLMLYLYEKSNHIMGNAVSFNSKEGYEGALVGRPELLEQYGIDIIGKPSYVFENAIDLDATSLYPSIIICYNIFKSALFGHVVAVKKPDDTLLGTGEGLFEEVQTIQHSIFEIAESYLGLPNIHTILKDIEETAKKKANFI